jgi:hypothetical protein
MGKVFRPHTGIFSIIKSDLFLTAELSCPSKHVCAPSGFYLHEKLYLYRRDLQDTGARGGKRDGRLSLGLDA